MFFVYAQSILRPDCGQSAQFLYHLAGGQPGMSQSTNRSVLNANSRPLWAVFCEEVSHALSYSVKGVQGRDREDARADKTGRSTHANEPSGITREIALLRRRATFSTLGR